MAIKLNDRELRLFLLGCWPTLHRALYVILRAKMDFTTALAGALPGARISWQMLREALYVQPRPGVKGGSPSINQLRKAARGLERGGYLRNLSDREQQHLIFRLVLADRHKLVQNKEDREVDREVDRQRATPMADLRGKEDREVDREVDSPPKEVFIKNINTSSSSKSPPQIDEEEEEGKEASQGQKLVWHEDLNGKIRRRIALMLADHDPEEARLLVAGLGAEIDRRKRINDPILRPLKYLAKMIADPNFDPSPAQAWLDRKQSSAATTPSPAAPVRSAPSAEFLALVSKLKRAIDPPVTDPPETDPPATL